MSSKDTHLIPSDLEVSEPAQQKASLITRMEKLTCAVFRVFLFGGEVFPAVQISLLFFTLIAVFLTLLLSFIAVQ